MNRNAYLIHYIDGFIQERRNSIASALELRLSCTNQSIFSGPFNLLTNCNNNRTLRWRHNDHTGVSNHQPHKCLLNRLFRRISKKTAKLRVTGLCARNSPGPVNSPHKGPVTRKMFPFDDVIMIYIWPLWPNESIWPHIEILVSMAKTVCYLPVSELLLIQHMRYLTQLILMIFTIKYKCFVISFTLDNGVGEYFR